MSEIRKAGQPPRILSLEEQEKLRTVCRVCSALRFSWQKVFVPVAVSIYCHYSRHSSIVTYPFWLPRLNIRVYHRMDLSLITFAYHISLPEKSSTLHLPPFGPESQRILLMPSFTMRLSSEMPTLRLWITVTFPSLFARAFLTSVCLHIDLIFFAYFLASSVNEVICHGIPDQRKLQEGDIVNIGTSYTISPHFLTAYVEIYLLDVTLYYDGSFRWYYYIVLVLMAHLSN